MKLDALLPGPLAELQVPLLGHVGDCSVTLALVFFTVLSLVMTVVVNKWRDRKLPPGPLRVPFWGSVGCFGPKFHKKCMQNRKTYGNVQSYYFGNRLVVVVNGYDDVYQVIQKRLLDFADRPIMNPAFTAVYSDELFFHGYDDHWKQNKKFAMKALKIFGAGSENLENKVKVEVDRLLEKIDRQKGQPMPIQLIIENALARVITSVIVSTKFKDDQEVDNLAKVVLDWFECFLIVPPLLYFNLPEFLRLRIYPEYHALLLRNKGLKDFVIARIQEHRQTRDPDNPRDVADLYLADRDGPDLDLDTLARTLLMLTPDGIDSLGCTMAFTLLFIAKFPEVQKKIQDEVDEVVGRDVRPTNEHKASLPYLQATLLEAQRLSTVFPISATHKPLHANMVVNGYTLPEDCWVFPNLYSVHMDEEVFPEPNKFDPGHFLNKQGEVVNANHCMIFSLGRRMCMGEQLAKAELFLFVAGLLQKYSFSFPDGNPPPSDQADVIGGITGMMMRRPVRYKLCATPRS